MFGVRDQQAREKLLRKANLTLADTDDICRLHEATVTQMKMVEEAPGTVNVVDTERNGLERRAHPAPAQWNIVSAEIVVESMILVSVSFALLLGRSVTSVGNPIILQ